MSMSIKTNVSSLNAQRNLSTTESSLTFQVGIRNVAANDRISVSTVDATATTLGVGAVSLATKAGAQGALGTIDTALQTVSAARATFGAAGNRLESVVSTIQT